MEAPCEGKGVQAFVKELPRLQLPAPVDLAHGPGEHSLLPVIEDPPQSHVAMLRYGKVIEERHEAPCMVNRGFSTQPT